MIIPERDTCGSASCLACLTTDCVGCSMRPAAHRDADTHKGFCIVCWPQYQINLTHANAQLAPYVIDTDRWLDLVIQSADPGGSR